MQASIRIIQNFGKSDMLSLHNLDKNEININLFFNIKLILKFVNYI